MTSDREVGEYFDSSVAKDLLRLVCGFDPIGSGAFRAVYPHLQRPDLVVKVEVNAGAFQNVNEWTLWEWCQYDKKISRWLAPCVAISSCGTILLQRRTEPARLSDFPASIPAFLTDTKRANFGVLDGRLVCHDYGMVRALMSNPMRMRRAEWWGDDG